MSKHLELAEDLLPVGKFKANAAGLLDAVRDGRTIVITKNGTAAAVVLSPAEFDAMKARQQLLEDIALGLSDVESKRVFSTAAVRRRLRKQRPKTR